MTTFSVIPDGGKTHVVMIWPEINRKYMDGLLRSFLSPDENVFTKLVNECVFVKSEDYCVSPVLWNSLPDEDRSYVRMTTRHEYYRGVVSRIPEIVKWNYASRFMTNVRT